MSEDTTHIERVTFDWNDNSGDGYWTLKIMNDISGFNPEMLGEDRYMGYKWCADILYEPTRIRFHNGEIWECNTNISKQDSRINKLKSVRILYVGTDSLRIELNFTVTLMFFKPQKAEGSNGIRTKLHSLDTRLGKLLLATAAAAPL